MNPTAVQQASAVRAHPARTWVPVLLVTLVPLAVLPGAFGPFHAPKWLLVAVLVPAGLAVCAATGALRWPRRNWFLAWIGVNLVAGVLGVAPWMSLFGSPQRNAGLLAVLLGAGAFVLGASTGDEGRTQRQVLRAAFLAGGVVGVLAVAERFGLDLFGLGDAGEITRGRSTWGSATFAGAHLVLVLPIAVAHLRSRDPRWRVAAAVSTAAILAGLVATGTRAAWLAALVSALVIVPAWRATPGPSGRSAGAAGGDSAPSGGRWAALVGLGLVGVVLVAFMVPELGRSSGVGRLDQWRTSVSVIADRPIIGSGPDTQRVVLPSGIDVSFEQEHGSEALHDRVHSLPLDTLVTTGVIGLVVLGALLVRLGRDIVTHLRRELVPTAIAAGLVAYLVTLLFAFGDPVIDPMAWMLAGLLIAAVVKSDRPGDVAADGGEGAPGPGRATGSGSWVLAAVFGVLAVTGLLWAGGEAMAERRLQAAMDLVDAGDIPGALDELSSAASTSPARFDLDQIASRLVVQALTVGPDPTASDDARQAMVADAFDRLDRAGDVAGDDPDLLMDRAELLTASGDPARSLELYERILLVYPNSFRAHLGIGLAASQLNQLGRAELAWSTAAELAPGDARAWVNLGILHERSGDPDAASTAFEQALEIEPDDALAAAGLDRVTGGEAG